MPSKAKQMKRLPSEGMPKASLAIHRGSFSLRGSVAALTFAVCLVIATSAAQADGTSPDRAYEAISPLPAAGVPFLSSMDYGVAVGPTGENVVFKMVTPFQGDVTNDENPIEEILQHNEPWPYSATRTDRGWKTTEIRAPRGTRGGPSTDVRSYLVGTRNGLDPDDKNGIQDAYLIGADGSATWLGRDPRIPKGTPQTAAGITRTAYDIAGNSHNELAGSSMSDDAGTVVFSSERQLLDSDTTPAGRARLYKWTDGQLSFIGRRPDGSVPATGAFNVTSRLGAPPPTGASGAIRTVSRDGRRVIFSALPSDSHPELNKTIYVQTDGAPTVEAVKATGVPALSAPEPFSVVFMGASADGSRVFFTSSSRLTPDSGASRTSVGATDLYVYDIESDEVRSLTPRLDGVDDPSASAPAPADQGRALGVAAVSEDGSRVYFVSDASYDTAPSPTGQLPSASGRNLYMAELDEWTDPLDLSFVAPLSASDTGVWNPSWLEHTAYASPDGEVLGFGSSEALTGQDTGGLLQLFVYDADSHSLNCASCSPDGSTPIEGANESLTVIEGALGSAWQSVMEKRWVGPDGSVYFHTATPLVQADRNQAKDVYEYRAGNLRLISAGTGQRQSGLENVSADGSTVVFSTSDALVAEDEEPGLPKLYAARVGGGGFIRPAADPPECDGAECRVAPDRPLADTDAFGSADFEGSGNPPKADSKNCTTLQRRAVRAKSKLERLRKQRDQAAGKRAKRLGKKVKRAKRTSQSTKRQFNRCARQDG